MTTPILLDAFWTELGVACAIGVLAIGAGAALHVVLYRLAQGEAGGSLFTPALVAALGRCPAPCVLPLVVLKITLGYAPESLPVIGPLRHAVAVVLVTMLAAVAVRLVRGISDAIIALFPPGEIAEALDAPRVRAELRTLSRSATTLILMIAAAVTLLSFPGTGTVGAVLLALSAGTWMVAGIAAMPMLDDVAARVEIALLARAMDVPDAPQPAHDATAPHQVKHPRRSRSRFGRRYCHL